MDEKAFVEGLKRSAKAIDSNAFTWKTNDRMSVGIPDLYVVIFGVSMHFEVKDSHLDVSHLDELSEMNPERSALRHPFSGPQIGLLREIWKAGGCSAGIIRVGPTLSLILEPNSISPGPMTVGHMVKHGFVCSYDYRVWRIDKWLNHFFVSKRRARQRPTGLLRKIESASSKERV